MSDYTPTTERVRNSYANDIASYPKPANVFEAAARADSAKEEFDRWLTEHDRQVAEKAWDEGFDAGERDVFEHFTKDDWEKPHACIQNPYREVSK